MMGMNEHSTDPYTIDPLTYLAELNGNLSASTQLEHYNVIKLALLRLQSEDPAAFDLALREVSKKLKIKAKTVREDLARLADPPTVKEARELLEQMGQTRQLRLAQDYVENQLWYGVRAGEDTLLLNSDRELLRLDQIPEALSVTDRGFDLCRISKDAILEFLSGRTETTGAELLTDLRHFFTRFAVFRDKRTPLLLAAWTLGTYCYRVFRVFPYLSLRSPVMRCGKSRLLDLLSLVAFNASGKLTNPTEAQIFRAPLRNGGTMLFDEIEALGKTNKDAYAGLLSVLNSGFEQGGSVPRLEKNGDGNFHEVSFETYCPRALAGINKLADTLEDRSITLVMQRKLKREKTERFSPLKLEDEAQALRDRCYLWCLSHVTDLAATYAEADRFFRELSHIDDRARDLWEPLLSLAVLADVERADRQKTLTHELTTLALDLCQVRDGAGDDTTTVHVIQALRDITAAKRQERLSAADSAITLTPTELANILKEKLGWEKLSTKYLADLLFPLGLSSKNTRFATGKVALAYHLTEQHLAELSERYARNETFEEDEKK